MKRTNDSSIEGRRINDRTGRDELAFRARQLAFYWLRLLTLTLFVFQISACAKQSDASEQRAIPPEPKNQTYRMIGGHSVISLVSSDELEIRQGGENLVCKYTKQDGRLRVVMNALGTTTAKYFNMTPEGLVDEDGDIYYSPESYEKAYLQTLRLQAEAGLGLLRSLLRGYYAANATYPIINGPARLIPEATDNYLDTVYLALSNITVSCDGHSFTITAARIVATDQTHTNTSISVTLDDAGEFTYSGF